MVEKAICSKLRLDPLFDGRKEFFNIVRFEGDEAHRKSKTWLIDEYGKVSECE